MKTYEAPWSTSLLVMSSMGTFVCISVVLLMIWSARGALTWVAVVPLLFVGGAALFAIRGYTVTRDAILVHRLFWTTRLPLADLQSAKFEPNAMRGGLRTFGNGGMFSFTGFFWNKTLGAYRAFVTDPSRIVVLRFSERTIVISPSEPADFVRQLNAPSHG